jgi:Zn-dependent protease with chaperone function
MPTRLDQIDSRSWEHPADRAALAGLRAIPGFDEVVRRIAGFFGERGVRQLFLADAVQVGPDQRPRLNALWTEVLDTMDWPERPELYVSQTPFANAAAVGFQRPFVIVHSGALEILDDAEIKSVLGHELGHIMSGHSTYTTIAILLGTFGASALPALAGLMVLPFQLAILEWYRKSEFSCDRAGLLAVQDLRIVMSTEMKLAGGPAYGDTIDVDAFIRQAEAYETGGDAWDTVFKMLNTAFRTHPFHTVRAAELLRWHKSGGYDTILAGTYLRRGEAPPPFTQTYSDAATYYGDQARETFAPVGDAFSRAFDRFNEAWRSK